MIIRTLLALLAVSSFLPTASGQKNNYNLKGFIGIQGGESFNYRLELKDSAGDLLRGYAYTYAQEKNDVKALVTAQVDRANKTLLLRELSIIHNNYFQSNALICLVDALLRYSPAEGSLSGPLTTATAGNGADCSKGSITFTNAAELDHLFDPKPAATPAAAKTAAVPDKSKPVRVVYDTMPKPGSLSRRTASIATPAVKKQETVTEGRDKTIEWESASIILDIWDGNNEDNDRVTLLLNGTEMLKDYTLRNAKKHLTFPVGGNELNIITIIAVSEGSDPPNTANIVLTDGDKQYEIVAHNTIGKKATIRIRKKM